MRDHLEVVGVGKRGLGAETEATGRCRVVTFGGVAIHAIDRADVGVGNTEAVITDGDAIRRDGHVDWLVGQASSNVGIPGIADDLTHHSQLRVGVEGGRENVHQGCVIADAHGHGFAVADYGMGDELVLLGDLHGGVLTC
ncbi:hypothetical protein D3C84_969540 [compost metagenome]